MTKEQILQMAREAGFFTHKEVQPEITRFATLVLNAAAIEERMALADLCDAMGSPRIAEYLRAQAEIIRKEPTT